MDDPTFDARRFLTENFQNPATLIAHVTTLGLTPPSQAQVEKWFSRNSVPADWLTKLVALLERETGEPVSLAQYMGPT